MSRGGAELAGPRSGHGAQRTVGRDIAPPVANATPAQRPVTDLITGSDLTELNVPAWRRHPSDHVVGCSSTDTYT